MKIVFSLIFILFLVFEEEIIICIRWKDWTWHRKESISQVFPAVTNDFLFHSLHFHFPRL